jgi:nucleolar MIF4G domain-containing protein 1
MRYHALSVGSSATSTLPANIYETPDASKESLNLLVLIAELYNAQVISAKLIYDLIRGFTDSGSSEQGVLGEREVEGLLKVIKSESLLQMRG